MRHDYFDITATINDANDDAIYDQIEIEDDTDFERVISLAKTCGERCCISWHRSTDGQSAYWGPRGATFEPYWYNA